MEGIVVMTVIPLQQSYILFLFCCILWEVYSLLYAFVTEKLTQPQQQQHWCCCKANDHKIAIKMKKKKTIHLKINWLDMCTSIYLQKTSSVHGMTLTYKPRKNTKKIIIVSAAAASIQWQKNLHPPVRNKNEQSVWNTLWWGKWNDAKKKVMRA